MAVTPAGRLAVPLSALRSMLSNCTTFQKLVKAANAAAALSYIHYGGVSGEQTRPWAVVRLNEYSPEFSAGGSQSCYVPRGTLYLDMEIPVRWNGTLTAVTDANSMAASGLSAHADDFFNGLRLTMLDGAAAGLYADVSDFTGATGAIELASDLSTVPSAADTFHISPATVADAEAHFLKTFGAIMDELLALSGTGGCLALHRCDLKNWGRSEDDKEQDYWGAELEVEFGP